MANTKEKISPCKYCGLPISRWDKQGDKYLKYGPNREGIQVYHDYDTICKPNQGNKQANEEFTKSLIAGSTAPSTPAQQTQTTISQSQVNVQSEDVKHLSAEIAVLRQLIAGIKLKTDRLPDIEKLLATVVSVQDTIAQKTELLVHKIGYPEPKPIDVPVPDEPDTPPEETEQKEPKAKKPGEHLGYDNNEEFDRVILPDGQAMQCTVCHTGVNIFYHPIIPDDNYDENSVFCENCFVK